MLTFVSVENLSCVVEHTVTGLAGVLYVDVSTTRPHLYSLPEVSTRGLSPDVRGMHRNCRL